MANRNILKNKTIGFIGAGKMGRGLMEGLMAHGVPARNLIASDPSNAIRKSIAKRGIRARACNCDVASCAEIAVLAVKPQEIREVLPEISECLSFCQLVISIAAGVTLKTLQAGLPGVPVVRVMPNLPSVIGMGFSAYSAGKAVSKSRRALAHSILEAVGAAVELPERNLDAVTAVSGSGPAYLFFLAQIWEDSAARLGLPKAVAREAVFQTLAGSLVLLGQGTDSPEAWIRRVASKRGTTEAALKVLREEKVAAAFLRALRAAAQRSKELSCS